MKSVREYLVEAKKYNKPHLKGLMFGNASADMDSVVGSIVMSWYYGSSVNPNYDPNGIKYIPVINCPKDELSLRFDILENLKIFGIDNAFIEANFIFTEDLRSRPSSMDSVESVGLIDFNKIGYLWPKNLLST